MFILANGPSRVRFRRRWRCWPTPTANTVRSAGGWPPWLATVAPPTLPQGRSRDVPGRPGDRHPGQEALAAPATGGHPGRCRDRGSAQPVRRPGDAPAGRFGRPRPDPGGGRHLGPRATADPGQLRGSLMRICAVIKYPPIQGGVSTHGYWLARSLAMRGHQGFVVTNADEVEPDHRVWIPEADRPLLDGQFP